MRKLTTLIAFAVAIPIALTTFSGCRPNSVAREIAEEEIAEAVVDQAITSYHSATINIEGEYASVGLTCGKGGSLTWAEYDSDGEICYETATNGCTMDTTTQQSLSLTGQYNVCGFPASYTDGKIEDLDGKTLYIDGSVTISGPNIDTRTCTYALDITTIAVTVDPDTSSITFSSGVSGQMCDRRGFSSNVSFTLEDQIEADESLSEPVDEGTE